MKPLDRSGIIRQSVFVFICGLIGFLPLIGILPALNAVIKGIRIHRAYPGLNPVDHYRKWGILLGGVCILLNGCALAIAIGNMIDAVNRGYWVDME